MGGTSDHGVHCFFDPTLIPLVFLSNLCYPVENQAQLSFHLHYLLFPPTTLRALRLIAPLLSSYGNLI